MSYVPVGAGRTSPDVENIELTAKNDGQTAYGYAPPQGLLPDGDIRYSDSKANFPPSKVVDNWPIKSRQVAALTPLRGTILAFDIILASSPLLFIVLALRVARLDGKAPRADNDKLQEMLLYTPTIFPLLFAALMGRFFRHFGIWLAERGTTLGRLEQLVGCQSVFLAIERQICLRNFSTIGVCSILIWLLSPFGGQSALRVLRQEERYLNTTQALHYLGPLDVQQTTMGGASMVNSGRSTFTPLFLAALLSSGGFQTNSADLWGNVKLPSYRAIENSTSNDWKPVPDYNQTNVRWSSLIGIPVSAFNGEPFTTYSMNHFKIRARQFDISCSNNSRVAGDWTDSVNTTVRSTWMMETGTQQPSCSNNSTGCLIKACPSYPCPFISKSSAIEVNGEEFTSVANCEYFYDYIEASIECIASTCKATALRKLDMYTDGYTKEWEPYLLGTIMATLMNTMTSVDTIGVSSVTARGATVMEKWMYDPTDFIGSRMYGNVNLYELPVETFAERLTILWNSFFQSTYAARALAGNLDKATSTNMTGEDNSAIVFNTTESLTSQRRDVYRVNWKWFGVLLSCSLVLLSAACAGLVLKYLSIAPDIIGYASSLTMLSPYVPTPTGGTTLHGLERTALLHDLPVRLGDVCPNEPVGAIALAANDGRVVGLDRRRWYI
ncbi:hypothetical protein BU25DRAFT_430599 [Macroventuria anomochaeta]|uniref:Uncharacterized protein n=1 Tax=Macroventuria anomochaeta TaxID=301207 RepID=A0ACB6S6L2_9PLEO|nr:uncharacterized protein BU25DRAFT_430599 [Macroventuria anomochaeta]KAF2628777.1 hypothetical protein BU25DRAFT_430599 [Macroventuria anomochaeta]